MYCVNTDINFFLYHRGLNHVYLGKSIHIVYVYMYIQYIYF